MQYSMLPALGNHTLELNKGKSESTKSLQQVTTCIAPASPVSAPTNGAAAAPVTATATATAVATASACRGCY